MNEEAPQIVGVIDERAPDVIMKQEYVESGKWKKIGETASKLSSSKHGKHKNQDHSDESPPRKVKAQNVDLTQSPDMSPPRRSRKYSLESPPRRSDNNQRKTRSPQRRRRKDSDESPQRMRPNRRDSSENSPHRRSKKPESTRQRNDSPDNSPPRRHEKIRSRKESSDISPPRKSQESRKIKTERRDSDASPPRRSRKLSSSPRRERRSRWSPEVKREPISPRRRSKSRDMLPPKSKKMMRTLDGKVSGLQDAGTLKRENEAFMERQEKLFSQLRPEMSGRDAEVVIRDRRGRNKQFEYEVEDEQRKAAAEEARKKEYDRWGKGLKQIEDLEKRYQEHMHEASKPLARMADDEDLQDHLRHQERLDDPMLEYMRKKKDEENKKKGVEVKPKYLGQFPDNRYNIRPGYRWDGVDRSNGYEKKYFSMVNSKKSLEEEAYRYSTEDM